MTAPSPQKEKAMRDEPVTAVDWLRHEHPETVRRIEEQAATEARRELLALCDEVDLFVATMRAHGVADFVRLQGASTDARSESPSKRVVPPARGGPEDFA